MGLLTSLIGDGGSGAGGTYSTELLPAWAYGHSWVVGTQMSTVGAKWIDRVKSRLHLGTLTNRAVSGSTMKDVLETVINGANAWTVDTAGLVFVEVGGAEMTSYNMTDVQQAGMAQSSLRAALLILSSSARAESSTFTESGTWSTASQTFSSGGSVRQATAIGNYTEFAVTGDKAWVLVNGFDPASFLVHDIDVTVDGQPYSTVRLDVADNDVDLGFIVKHAIEITGMGAGAHTVRLTVAANARGAGTEIFMQADVALTPSLTPPTIVFVRDVRFHEGNITVAEKAAVDAIVDAAITGLDHVVDVDPSVGYDPDTMTGSDDTHPNDLGQAHYASAVEAALRPLAFRKGMNTLTT